jgi:zinc protease
VKVYVEPNHELPLVSFSLAFRAGSASDPEGKEGLARVTARLLRRGAAGLGAFEVEAMLDALGGEMTNDVGLSLTTFGFEAIERNVDVFVERAGAILAGPAFDESELGRLLRESEGELVEARDNDRGLAYRALRRALFAGHPYGRRGAGSVASLRAITRDDVVAYYARHYNRANAIVAVSGDVTPERGAELAARLVAGLPEGPATPDPVPEPPPRPGRHLVFVDKPERTQTQLYIGSLGTHPADDDHLPLHVSSTVFGGTFTSRLMSEVRSKRGWSYGAYARLPIERHRETFTIWTAPADKDAAACLALELELLTAWHAGGVTPRELAFVKNYLARSHVFEIDTASKRVHQRLEADAYALPPNYHEGYVAGVKAVTKDAADASVRQRLDPSRLVITLVGTHDALGAAIEKAAGPLDSSTVLPFDFE